MLVLFQFYVHVIAKKRHDTWECKSAEQCNKSLPIGCVLWRNDDDDEDDDEVEVSSSTEYQQKWLHS